MENVRENFAKPRAACKNELPRGHPFTIAGGHLWHAAGSCRSLDLRAAVLRAEAASLRDEQSSHPDWETIGVLLSRSYRDLLASLTTLNARARAEEDHGGVTTTFTWAFVQQH